MAKLNFDSGSGSRDVTVQDFIDDVFGAGDPFASLEDGDTVEYTIEPDGKVSIFIYNTVYEFSPEEFEELRAKAPKVQFKLEEPEESGGNPDKLPAPDWDNREFESMKIVYDETGFQEETEPGKKGQHCPHCGNSHVVLHPNADGVVMHCGKTNKPVARIMKTEAVDNQAQNLVKSILERARKKVARHFSIPKGHCGICGSKHHTDASCPKEGMPI
jgi:hypothetical protein